MKVPFYFFIAIILLSTAASLVADTPIRTSPNKDHDPAIAYNSTDDEYLVVWTELSATSIAVMGQRTPGDGNGFVGSPFTIFSIGASPSVAYNSQANEYLVTASLSGNIIGQRVSASGTLLGSPIGVISKTNSIYSKILYNPLGNNYLLVAAELFDLGNDQANIKIFARKVAADGQPTGTEQLVREQGHGNYSDGARFSVAYAPIISTQTPDGRFLLAIDTGGKFDLTMLDGDGIIVSRVYDSQHPGNIVDDHIPFQFSKVGIAYNVDVAFGNFEGEDVFMVVWGDRENQRNSQPWNGIWAGVVPAMPIEYEGGSVFNTVFPVSAIPDHNITPEFSKTWKPVVTYNSKAYKFMVAWRETPTSDPQNDTKVNHIRANSVSSSIPNYSNEVLSAINGNEDPKNPAIAASNKNSNALVVWDDERNISANNVDLYGNLLSTTPAKTLIVTSPNGFEEWAVGTQQQITWESSDIGDFDVTIEYSTDNGVTYNFIAFQTTHNGVNSFDWIVPNTPSNKCLVRISASIFSDVSDATFTINENQQITVVAPNGGETWYTSVEYEIKWNSLNFNDPVNIYIYSTNSNNTYFDILVSNTENDGSYLWTPQDNSPIAPIVDKFKVGVADANKVITDYGNEAPDGRPFDWSDDFVNIIYSPAITVISPNGGEVWSVESQQEIKWTSSNFSDPVRIDFWQFPIGVWSNIGKNIVNTGSFLWTINESDLPAGVGLPMAGYIRVADATENDPDIMEEKVFDWSDNPFTITDKLTIISPNGGEVWEKGSQHEIKWTGKNTTDSVFLTYDFSVPFLHIFVYPPAQTIPNNGSYIWTVPDPFSGLQDTTLFVSCKIKISDINNSNNADESDFDFKIVRQINTYTGDSVSVDLGNGIEITFESVSSSGETNLNVTQTGSPPPNGFTIFGLPNYYNIETTASFTGNIRICINYDDTGLSPFEESLLRLLVYETPPGQWKDITTSHDLANNIICGEVSHLSEFAIMMPTSDPQVFTVTNTNDSGEGSFRNAIDLSNANANNDKIIFNIPKTDPNYDANKGVWFIRPVTYYQSILDSNLVIDGTSQRIFIGEDTNPEGPEIVFSGSNMSTNNGCLSILADNINIYEITINNFPSVAINISNSKNCIVSGCYIGTDYSGMASASNYHGISMGPNVFTSLIGPSQFLQKSNVVSGNRQNGIFVSYGSQNNIIAGNFIGVNKNASDTIRNKLRGIDFSNGADNNEIVSNIIGGNGTGINIYESNNNAVSNNFIGTDAAWEIDFGNSTGINISNNSQNNIVLENIIALNKGVGVNISGTGSVQNLIKRNSISNNLSLGIDNSDGGNLELASPIISSIHNNQIMGTAGVNQIIEIFADSSDEGQVYIDSTVSDANGNFSFTLSSLPNLPYITATARDVLGNTSEFSSPFLVTDIGDKKDLLPTNYVLEQNFPNPFNPSTKIIWQLPARSYTTLKIYDLLGNNVATLIDEYKSAGIYEVELNGSKLTSGVYFYQLRAGNFIFTKKMSLIK